MAQQLTQYLASDGSVHETEAAADAHDAVSALEEQITAFTADKAAEAGKSERAAKNAAKLIREWEAYKLTSAAEQKAGDKKAA